MWLILDLREEMYSLAIDKLVVLKIMVFQTKVASDTKQKVICSKVECFTKEPPHTLQTIPIYCLPTAACCCHFTI